MPSAYYNENDPFAARWLSNLIRKGLITPGEVDDRPIEEVSADDLKGFTQHHFFAGIGGWSYALRLAGWPDGASVWTGSCPCQPFSKAARGRVHGFNDERHYWPVWRDLVRKRRPPVVFGEQVSRAMAWLSAVKEDMEAIGYRFAAADLCASVVSTSPRDRLYFVADANGNGERHLPIYDEVAFLSPSWSLAPVKWRELLAVGSNGNGIPGRVGRLRGYGNAIVPQVAAEFVSAYMETDHA